MQGAPVASLAGPLFTCTHTGTGETSLLGAGPWQASGPQRRGRARQRKEVRKEEGRRPTRVIEKLGRKGVVRPTHLPHLPRSLVALASDTVYLSHPVLVLLFFWLLSLQQWLRSEGCQGEVGDR